MRRRIVVLATEACVLLRASIDGDAAGVEARLEGEELCFTHRSAILRARA